MQIKYKVNITKIKQTLILEKIRNIINMKKQ